MPGPTPPWAALGKSGLPFWQVSRACPGRSCWAEGLPPGAQLCPLLGPSHQAYPLPTGAGPGSSYEDSWGTRAPGPWDSLLGGRTCQTHGTSPGGPAPHHSPQPWHQTPETPPPACPPASVAFQVLHLILSPFLPTPPALATPGPHQYSFPASAAPTWNPPLPKFIPSSYTLNDLPHPRGVPGAFKPHDSFHLHSDKLPHQGRPSMCKSVHPMLSWGSRTQKTRPRMGWPCAQGTRKADIHSLEATTKAWAWVLEGRARPGKYFSPGPCSRSACRSPHVQALPATSTTSVRSEEGPPALSPGRVPPHCCLLRDTRPPMAVTQGVKGCCYPPEKAEVRDSQDRPPPCHPVAPPTSGSLPIAASGHRAGGLGPIHA